MIPGFKEIVLKPEGKVLLDRLVKVPSDTTLSKFATFIGQSSTVIEATPLITHIISIFRYNEIFDDTYDDVNHFYDIFLDGLEDVFKEYRDYFEEILTNYNKQYDYTTGIIKTKIKTKNGTKVSEDYINRTDGATEAVHDLPNRVLSSSDISGYASQIIKNDNTTGINDTNTDTYNLAEGETITDPSQLLSLKRQYLRQVRDVYDEFAHKFKDCFLFTY